MSGSASGLPGRSKTLIATDLDGTLWDHDAQCHPATIEAVRYLQSIESVELIAATGRRRNSTRAQFDRLGISMPAVLLNGSVGFDFPRDELFHAETFAPGALETLLDTMAKHGVSPVAFMQDTTAVALPGVTTCPKHLEALGEDLEWWTADRLAMSDSVLGMSMLGIEQHLVQAPLDELSGYRGATISRFSDDLYPPYSVMIAPPDINKQTGIMAWCEHTNLVPERLVAIGDAGNDLAMLEAADLAVAVSSARPDVLDVADTQIRPPAEGGWADLIDLLGLN